MKAVILAGGLGSRLSEETALRPKPMVEIGGKPILWHIMKIYGAHGITDFIICLGYKGYMIKEYFANYFLHTSDVTIDLSSGGQRVHSSATEPWRVTLVDTGETSMTGGRLKLVQKHVGEEPFCLTYGDGVSDLNIGKLIEFHRSHGKIATVTGTQPPGRYGSFRMDGNKVVDFVEKPLGDGGGWINGGFFVLSPPVFSFIEDLSTYWEREPMERLAREGQLQAYLHSGFWQAMDTLRDKNYLEELWKSGSAPWKVW
jgi:glucose-1-phosphate cytidylyltransferase